MTQQEYEQALADADNLAAYGASPEQIAELKTVLTQTYNETKEVGNESTDNS